MTSTLDRDILTPEQVADYLQLRKETIYRYIRSGHLYATKVGRSYRVSRDDILSFLRLNSTDPAMREEEVERVALEAVRWARQQKRAEENQQPGL